MLGREGCEREKNLVEVSWSFVINQGLRQDAVLLHRLQLPVQTAQASQDPETRCLFLIKDLHMKMSHWKVPLPTPC